ncbi:ribosome recycling factor [Oceanococcus atlanticus]|uniref:Ribosome-recycling factor n=1 Tax=Oceanococcus atlanticus TaxID=1317117 RepID=A0A1Y1SDG0_9GAMM|nr:ribosome recycling factor [Oceanococcus atlanticus]ORE87036.1 ribosome recycling factor [Oceanococcus atlanticus]RZO86789.1 MAG: ribosome recycling factor [Oceanococcus sp.]
MIDDVKKDASTQMGKAIEALGANLRKIRTGRAHPSLLDHVMVDYYGGAVPIGQCANVTVEDGRSLVITPWERDMVGKIEKAIMTSELGLNPNTAGTVIRITMPPLTEERRRDLAKIMRGEGESARISIRNARRDANQTLKDMVKEKMISEDDEHRGEQEIQKLTDKYVAEVEALLDAKETEIMSV